MLWSSLRIAKMKKRGKQSEKIFNIRRSDSIERSVWNNRELRKYGNV